MELFKIFGTLALNGTDEFNKDADKASQKGQELSNKIGKGLEKAAKIGAAALSAAAAAVGALVKESLESYAEYEQLVGGAQLMYGEAYDYVAEQAANAYSTVQMSQNEYLQQVNGFATGLKTALGGNERAAAELAHKIITAEADVVAATGNSQEAVQNAFNGIMKSNYTMLDNLQLGITPTKEGFQEVIDKVNDWNKANGEATDYQIDNLADCQAALVDYIAMQGLSGYAAKEAAGTITGSLSMVKASWSNLLTGIADENADISQLIINLAESSMTAAKNIGERISVIWEGLQSVREEVPSIDALATAFEYLAGVLVGAKIGSVLQSVVSALKNAKTTMAAFNAVVAANPLVAFATVLGAVGVAAYKMVTSTKDALVGMPESYEEATAKVDELKAKIEEYQNIDAVYWTDQHQQELDAYRLALIDAEKIQAEFAASTEETSEAVGDSTVATAQTMQTAIDEYTAEATALFDKYKETYSQMFSQVGSWFSPFDEAKSTVETSVSAMMTAMQSQIDFNNNYAASLQSLKEYGLGALADELQTTGESGAAYAQAIVDAVEKAGGASTEEGQKIIQDFQSLDQQVQDSQATVATELTNLSGEFESKLGEITQTLAESIDDMEMGSEAYTAAKSTMQEYLNGINSMSTAISNAVGAIASSALSKLQASLNDAQAMADGATPDGSHARGLNYVPFDNYIAELHRGEAVLTAEEATAWRAGKSTAEGAATYTVGMTNTAPDPNVARILDVLEQIAANGLNANVNGRSLYKAVASENRVRSRATNYNGLAMV